jgi:transcriptional regulator with XRE-family HTH domain
MDREVASLGQRVRQIRVSQGLDQATAAAAIGVSQPSYSRIEAGQRPLKGGN